MTHKLIETFLSFMAVVGIVGCVIALLFVAMDVLEVYLKLREHVLNGDLSKRKDGK